MASKYAKEFAIPEEFPDILRNFSRELLREQNKISSRKEICVFAVNYFRKLIAKRDGKKDNETASGIQKLSDEEICDYVNQLFQMADADGNGYLDFREFKRVFSNMSDELKLSSIDINHVIAEADENDDGIIEYREFVPIAIQLIQSLRAIYANKEQISKRRTIADFQARELLLHGMEREEVQSLLSEIFCRADVDGNGSLSRREFMRCIRDADLGFTRKEINVLMMQVDTNQDGRVSYAEFIPMCFEILVQMYANDLLSIPKEEEELASRLVDEFKRYDTQGTGLLPSQDIAHVLRKVDVGLTRIQITGIMSEAEEDSEGCVDYEKFSKSVSTMVMSIIDFDQQINASSKLLEYRKSDKYHIVEGLHQHDFEHALSTAFEAMDCDLEGYLPKSDIREAIQNAFPEICDRRIRALMSLASIKNGNANYHDILSSAFQTLQWLDENEY